MPVFGSNFGGGFSGKVGLISFGLKKDLDFIRSNKVDSLNEPPFFFFFLTFLTIGSSEKSFCLGNGVGASYLV